MTKQLSTAHSIPLTKYTKEQLKYTKQILTDIKEKIDNDTIIVQFSSVAQSCPTLCDPMNHSTPGLPVHHQLPEFIANYSRKLMLFPRVKKKSNGPKKYLRAN